MYILQVRGNSGSGFETWQCVASGRTLKSDLLSADHSQNSEDWFSKGSKELVIGNYRKVNLPHIVSERFATACTKMPSKKCP